MPNRSIVRYAVVGLGHIAQVAVLPAFKNARRNSRLTALVTDDGAKARELGYTNIFTAVTYADEAAVPQFQREGQALREWRSRHRRAAPEVREPSFRYPSAPVPESGLFYGSRQHSSVECPEARSGGCFCL